MGAASAPEIDRVERSGGSGSEAMRAAAYLESQHGYRTTLETLYGFHQPAVAPEGEPANQATPYILQAPNGPPEFQRACYC